MRQLIVRVPAGKGKPVVKKAQEWGALSATWWPSNTTDGGEETVSMVMENRSVGHLLEELGEMTELRALLYPHEVITFRPPASKAPEALRNLQARSPLEIYLLSIQSMGSLPSFLAYAGAGAVLAWIGFFTNSVYLLIAAMLIAPFAGPAMNIALATATGDRTLAQKALLRYGLGILATTVVAGSLSLAFQQTLVTDLMTGVGHVSAAAVLLPLVAGAAGAFNITQSDRTSLVSGTAVGMLVTASLAPPAALLGAASVMLEWELVTNAAFQLLLQLVGINLAGSLTFRQQGLTTRLVRYQQGNRRFFFASLILTVVALGGMLTWQLTDPLRLERSSASTRATEIIREVVQESEWGTLISVEASFRSSDSYGENALLAHVYVERPSHRTVLTDAEMATQLRDEIQRQLQFENPQVAPLVNVTFLDPPPFTPMPAENVGE
jgi:uncharacterized membrane protein